jgi:hypothetical protein
MLIGGVLGVDGGGVRCQGGVAPAATVTLLNVALTTIGGDG